MKIEKISNNQIRCTLSREDLIDRELRISELAYGTEKAKALFREMMQQASYEFGFEADDIPLMIEAIPISTESLILVITKVEDPDELDTRFSKFSPDHEDDNYMSENDDEVYADEILNSFHQLSEILDGNDMEEAEENDEAEDAEDTDDTESTDENNYTENTFIPLPETLGKKKDLKQNLKLVSIETDIMKIFSFDSLESVIKLAEHIVYFYHGQNSVYKNPITKSYYLVISKSDHTPEEFNKVCNILAEFGKAERTTYASSSYYQEHFELIVKDNAIQILSVM